MRRLEPLLAPIYAALQERSGQSALHHADETRWQVFTEKQGKIGYSWWLWVFAGEDAVAYLLDPSRSHKVPQGILATTMFSIFATLKLAKLNPQRWLTWHLEARAQQHGHAPADIRPYLPSNLSPQRRAELAERNIPRNADTS